MVPKASPLHLVLAALAGLPTMGVPLVLAQSEPPGAPAAQATVPEPADPPASAPPRGAQPSALPMPPSPPPLQAPAEVRMASPPLRTEPRPSQPIAAPSRRSPHPLRPSVDRPLAGPAPLRATPEQRATAPVPRSFDASLDALVRDQVIKPSEQVRVRGGMVLPRDLDARNEACDSGALSSQECRSGVVFLGRGRMDGKGSLPLAMPDGSAAVAAGAMGGLSGARVGIDAMPLPPISVPVSALLSGSGGNFRLADVFRVTPRPGPILGNGDNRLLFPLIGSAVTTSGFGWRLHPVIGSWLMHAGRDLAAPEGTTVVAALSGKVVSSGLAGGYGLAVEIEHSRPRRRTLYGHLSELYVKPGETVRQGEVIGRVGSTGLSTGPHLHFELRVPEGGGWVAVDPGDMDSSGTMIATFPGASRTAPPDAVALLMGQLIQSLERPRSPLPLPGESLRPPAQTPASGGDRAPRSVAEPVQG